MDDGDLEREIERLRDSRHSTEGALGVLAANLQGIDNKLNAIHNSLRTDTLDLNKRLEGINSRVNKAELRLARLQGAGAALTLGLPFIAAVIGNTLHL
jgi:chromosome segregation ATPase